VVAPEVSVHIKHSKKFEMKIHSVPYAQEDMDQALEEYFHLIFEEGSFLKRFLKAYEGTKKVINFGISSCEQLLKDKELIRYLEERKF
ncbi:UD14 glucuronosyltransferase, partial [Pomatostomus ruficeps]|nr:UD14 glucuronosyltransferase [Pomatostomus ruficeps]